MKRVALTDLAKPPMCQRCGLRHGVQALCADLKGGYEVRKVRNPTPEVSDLAVDDKIENFTADDWAPRLRIITDVVTKSPPGVPSESDRICPTCGHRRPLTSAERKRRQRAK